MSIQIANRRNVLLLFAVAIAAVAGSLLYTGSASGDDDKGKGKRYEVTITNITKGQIISPAVVATHRRSLDPIYSLGNAASDELAGLAEDAALGPFIAMLNADPAVSSVEVITGAGGPIMPGETASIVITANGRAKSLSLAAMLVTTNDAFVGLNGIDLPGRYTTHMGVAYDAGSEANNEDCDFIPGPPCGNGGVRDTAGAEGYVYVSSGVHGIADLVPADHDWNNAVAKITVRRISGGGDNDEDDD